MRYPGQHHKPGSELHLERLSIHRLGKVSVVVLFLGSYVRALYHRELKEIFWLKLKKDLYPTGKMVLNCI
jgi:hypothetical protein